MKILSFAHIVLRVQRGEFIENWKKEQIENYLNEPGRLYGIFPTTGKLSEQDIEELRKLL